MTQVAIILVNSENEMGDTTFSVSLTSEMSGTYWRGGDLLKGLEEAF